MIDRQIGRLNDLNINRNHSLYLHYNFYHKELFKALQSYAKGNLLDIGCGNKPYKQFIEGRVKSYLGCDIIQSDNNAVDLICSANKIPLNDDLFETIISTQTIEHVEDPHGLISEAYRLLKNNGYLIISGPMYWPLHEEPYDFFRFTKYGFQHMLEQAGFKVTSVCASGGKWALAGQALLHAIYPTIYNIRGIKGKIIKFIARIFRVIKLINILFEYMDNRVTDHSNTMNYVVIAQKIN
ncbi:hypothetical protein ASE74_12310 [Pedobacter sp. Leaf216]|uniref:class I SAM-dependent methyltransferase n=1 Tax=Pedobacter sp. Leaf216 TaxID=1735684 RepID=UPI0006F7FD4B|nr:class I SAM-dependent methyltransferase [Pedobacter sp. Leaf216]KQM63944.1 hypothetical protein ASE74_12310 [Pedobacter sp. Leaf216]